MNQSAAHQSSMHRIPGRRTLGAPGDRSTAIPVLLLGVPLLLLSLFSSWAFGATILWSADHETSDLSQWTGDGNGGIWISSTAEAKISTAHSHSGRYANALTIYNANGATSPSPGVRMARVGTTSDPNRLPDAAYYSVWYYFPQVVRPANWWNLFQWKRRFVRPDGSSSSDPVYDVNIGNRTDGTMYFYLYSHVGNDGKYETQGVGIKASSPVNIPVNQWVNLECYYLWSIEQTGRVTCWQDNQPIMDVRNVITEFSYGDVSRPRQWTVNNYSSQTDPPTQTIYIDDAAISESRMITNPSPSPPTNLLSR